MRSSAVALEAVAEQMVGAAARYEGDVESLGLKGLELGAQVFTEGIAGRVRVRGFGHRDVAWSTGRGGCCLGLVRAGLPARGQALFQQGLNAGEAFGDVGNVAGQPGFDGGQAFADSVDAVAVGGDPGAEVGALVAGFDHEPAEHDGDECEAENGCRGEDAGRRRAVAGSDVACDRGGELGVGASRFKIVDRGLDVGRCHGRSLPVGGVPAG